MSEGMSFFGSKVVEMIRDAQTVADGHNFTNKVNETIDDLISIVNISLEAVIASCENKLQENNTGSGFEHFESPTLEEHTEEETQLSDNLLVDGLLAESYTYGKSDEQIAGEFKGDLNKTIRDYAWIFVAIGIALDSQDKREIANVLTKKMIEIKKREQMLGIQQKRG